MMPHASSAVSTESMMSWSPGLMVPCSARKDSAVRIIAARAKILGLEQADPVVNKNLVLVMGEKEEDADEPL